MSICPIESSVYIDWQSVWRPGWRCTARLPSSRVKSGRVCTNRERRPTAGRSKNEKIEKPVHGPAARRPTTADPGRRSDVPLTGRPWSCRRFPVAIKLRKRAVRAPGAPVRRRFNHVDVGPSSVKRADIKVTVDGWMREKRNYLKWCLKTFRGKSTRHVSCRWERGAIRCRHFDICDVRVKNYFLTREKDKYTINVYPSVESIWNQTKWICFK